MEVTKEVRRVWGRTGEGQSGVARGYKDVTAGRRPEFSVSDQVLHKKSRIIKDMPTASHTR
jgi:hypothetical protein